VLAASDAARLSGLNALAPRFRRRGVHTFPRLCPSDIRTLAAITALIPHVTTVNRLDVVVYSLTNCPNTRLRARDRPTVSTMAGVLEADGPSCERCVQGRTKRTTISSGWRGGLKRQMAAGHRGCTPVTGDNRMPKDGSKPDRCW
jgi:hypothetical protein